MAPRLGTAILTSAVTAVFLMASAGTAHASCMLDDRPLDARIAEAPIVLKGTVTAVRHNDTTADLRVEEVWKGSGDLEQVIVQGGTGEDGAMTSVDRSWQVGETYLVFPQPDGARLLDNACSATQGWTEELAAFRPEGASSPASGGAGGTGEPSDGGGSGLPIALGVAALAAAGGGTAWALRRRAAA